MNQEKVKRTLIYFIGIITLSLGLALNVSSYLGVAPVLSIPRCIADITQWDFSNLLLAYYIIFILLQVLIQRKDFRFVNLLQVPLGILITRLVRIFTKLIPTTTDTPLMIRILVLVAAIIVTGVGVALSVDMKMIPNPADGFAAALGEYLQKGLGFGKNAVDLGSVAIAVVIGLCSHHIVGVIGVGTLAAGLLVGRVIAVVNKIWKDKLEKIAGIKGELE